MEDFAGYLETAFERNFVQGEYNNTVRDLYGILQAGVRLEADTLAITPAFITLAKGGVPSRQLNIGKLEQAIVAKSEERFWVRFRQALRVILKHDATVSQHLQLVEDGPQGVTYQIVLNPRSQLDREVRYA